MATYKTFNEPVDNNNDDINVDKSVDYIDLTHDAEGDETEVEIIREFVKDSHGAVTSEQNGKLMLLQRFLNSIEPSGEAEEQMDGGENDVEIMEETKREGATIKYAYTNNLKRLEQLKTASKENETKILKSMGIISVITI